jgi:hypothetical protein
MCYLTKKEEISTVRTTKENPDLIKKQNVSDPPFLYIIYTKNK